MRGLLLALLASVSWAAASDGTRESGATTGPAGHAATVGRDDAAQDAATRRLLQAANRGRVRAVEAALEAGARIDENRLAFVGNDSGQTALVSAALRGDDQVVRLLLERGADPMIPEKDGFTVWHAAAFQGRTSVLAVLDELEVPGYGISPADGYTPLHRAAWGLTLRHVRAVRYLVGPSGRACDSTSRNGKTPLDMAKHAETKAVLEACLAGKPIEVDVETTKAATGTGRVVGR